jgi:hypothetical protein
MKKIIIVILLCTIVKYVKAQTNTFPGSGSVGIGTTAPRATLHVDPKGPGGITIGTDDGATVGLTTLMMQVSSQYNGYSWLQSIKSAGGGWGVMSLNPSGGNVGIGTTTPNTSLDVNGGVFLGGNNLDGVNINYLSNSGKMLLGWNRSQGQGETDFISNQGPGGSGGFAYYNYSNTGTQSLLMNLRGNGQLTIGDCNPYSYKLAVGGSMIAESVTIKLLANWPDYVFKPSYNLKPLSEVKTYIDLNHHLPEMPSEKEVAEKGIDLGEMNKLLMKKVEELTLYLIEKDNRDKMQQDEIDKLKKQIKEIASKLK